MFGGWKWNGWVRFPLVNRKLQPLAAFPLKWTVTSVCVCCGQWRPDVRHRAGQRQEQPSSDPGRGRKLCEDQSGGEAEGASGDVQPQRDVFIEATWFWLLTWRDATWPPAVHIFHWTLVQQWEAATAGQKKTSAWKKKRKVKQPSQWLF